MENGIRTTTINLWNILVRRLPIIALSSVLVVAAVFAFKSFTYVPEYKSTATLYILRQNETGSANEVGQDFSLALNVVNDCTYLLKSHAVLDEVIDSLKLDITYNELTHNVSTNNPENTRILEVSVKSNSPENAKKIVDSVCDIGSKNIEAAMGFDQVNLYEKGTIESSPCNKTGTMTYVLIGLAVAFAAYAAFVIAFIADDRIRTDEDVETYLGISVLGNIPNTYENLKGKHGNGYSSNDDSLSSEEVF